MPQTPGNSSDLNKIQTSSPDSGSEISEIISSNELGLEVESLGHEINQDPPVLPESQPPSSQKLNFKSHEKEKTVETCAPTEDAGKYDVIFSGKVEIISKEQFVSKISQTIPRLEKIQKYSKIPHYLCQEIAEAMSLLKMDLDRVEVGESLPEGSQVVIGVPGKGLGIRPNINSTKKTNKKSHTFESAKDSWDQVDDIINVEVAHIDGESLHTESPPFSMKQYMMKPLPPLLEIFKNLKKGRQ
ncbi:hypothetical protein O181_021028 [Austropuccinia psidii MF-1]|uniref:Uncharacterized protein n=1 Tax=Austropuccinia psidii MF-1 TaxID=1389203 RepID=A0A9Q3GV23_9BASI|nr:hypothetical protein [Austropuccinia psidii MF-1]